MKTILTDGVSVFGIGDTDAEAIADAVANCSAQKTTDGQMHNVTDAWIAEQIAEGGLWVRETNMIDGEEV